MRRRKRLLVVSGLLVTVGLAAGIAWATIPSNGVITGCYLKAGGGLRVIDETVTANCKSNETKLQWNVQGEKGEPGAKGDPGANGADGIAGPTSLGEASGTIDDDGVVMATHTVAAAEAGLNLIWANVTVYDRSGTTGGNTVVDCFLLVNGSGSGNPAVVRDNGETDVFRADAQHWSRMERETLVAGDVVTVECRTDVFDDDAEEAGGNGQLMLAKVGS